MAKVMRFRWNDWNLEHATRHGVSPQCAEYVVQTARAPYPEQSAGLRYLVWGQDQGGRYVQVVFLLDVGERVYIIHARPLNDREKHRYRRRMP